MVKSPRKPSFSLVIDTINVHGPSSSDRSPFSETTSELGSTPSTTPAKEDPGTPCDTATTMSSVTDTDSDKNHFRDQAVLGSESFFSFANASAANPRTLDDLDTKPVTEHIADTTDYLNISPYLVPGYTLTRQIQPRNQQYDLIYHAFKNDDANLQALQNIPPLSPVIVRVSHSVSQTHSLARFLNEWYLLSGLQEPARRRCFSNPALVNEYPGIAGHGGDCNEPITLPRKIPGILFPVAHSSFTLPDDPNHKRLALVFPNAQYKPIKMFTSSETLSLSEQHQRDLDSFDYDTTFRSGSIESLDATSDFISNLSTGEPSLTSNKRVHPQRSCLAPIKVLEILHDMLQVAKTLALVHDYGFVHNGINLVNILKSQSDPTDIKLTGWDFGFSVLPEDAQHGYRIHNLMEVSPLVPYMSPELCREDSKGVDHRSDFYSMGIVMYELLVGHVPFYLRNASSLIKMHIAKPPLAPAVACPQSVSPELNRIIMKLLEKLPGKRYQDAYSFVHDLSLARNDAIQDFVHIHPQVFAFYEAQPNSKHFVTPMEAPHPEKCGVPPVFLKPRGVFGRDKEYHDAFAAYNDSNHGMSIVLVHGAVGSGVSSFVNSMRASTISKPLLQMHCKHSAQRSNLAPYQSSIVGIKLVVQQILVMHPRSVAEWREKLRHCLPKDVPIIFEKVPELGTLMGPTYISAACSQSPHQESHVNVELKLRYVIKILFSAFSTAGLTIYIDDLQWCPEPEWEFLSEILDHLSDNDSDEKFSFKLVVGYSMGATAVISLEAIEKTVKRLLFSVHRVFLGPISKSAYTDYIHAMVLVSTPFNERGSTPSLQLPRADNCEQLFDEETTILADKLYLRTGGCILKTRAIFATAAVRGLLHFDSRPTRMRWSIDADLPEFCHQLMVLHYSQTLLPSDAINLLQFAALVAHANNFYLSDLLIVLTWPLSKVYVTLHYCIERRLVVPTSTFYKVPFHLMMLRTKFPFDLNENDIWNLVRLTKYRFQHDCVHTDLVQIMKDNGDYGQFHKLCGQRYYKAIREDDPERYQQMASHFEQSWREAEPSEHDTYRSVLILAGQMALQAYNLRAAIRFFETADRFISVEESNVKIKSIMTICQSHYQLGEYSECLRCMDDARNQYGFDENIFILVRVRCYIQSGRIDEGIEIATEGLKRLGLNVPAEDSQLRQKFDKNLVKVPLSIAEIRLLQHSPYATQPLILLLFELVLEIVAASYDSDKRSLRWFLVTKVVLLMHKYGPSLYCAMSLVEFANILVKRSEYEALDQAREYCRLALHLVKSIDTLASLYVQKVHQHYIASLALFVEPINTVIEHNDLYNNTLYQYGTARLSAASAHARATKAKLLIMKSQPLESIISNSMGKTWTVAQLKRTRNVQLCGLALIRGDISLQEMQEVLPSLERESPLSAFPYYNTLTWHYAIYDMVDEAKHYAFKANEIQPDLPNVLVLSELYLVCCYVFLICDLSEDERARCSELFSRMLHIYYQWQRACPALFAPKYAFVRAAQMAYEGEVSSLEVLDAFEDAIDRSKQANQWYDVGWFSLTCFRWLVHRGHSRKRVIQFARQGLVALKRLDFKLGTFFAEVCVSRHISQQNWAGLVIQEGLDEPPVSPACERSPSDARPLRRLLEEWYANGTTLNQAIKACLMMTDSLGDDRIALQLLKSTLEFSGADRGVVVVMDDKNDDMMVRALGTSESVYGLGQPLACRTEIAPYALIMHLISKGEIVDKNDDRIYFEGCFGKEDYFQENDCPALICVPLMGHTSLFGALYLECRARLHVRTPFFDESKRDLLDLLCTQAAVLLSKSRLYRQLALAKKAAEDATAEKASFLANMSHEIRTPFNSLLLCAIFLLDTELSDTQREYVDTIRSLSMVTLNIIDGILAFSKIEHGSFTLANTPFSLNECIESSLLLSGEEAARNDLEFVFDNRCLYIDTIEGDITRYRQVVINMVGNALKFTLEGLVIVELDAKELALDRYQLTVTVRDTGIGIADGAKGRVFGAFSQVDGSSLRKYGGSGLGLAISKKLAGIMGGLLDFTSEEGKGTAFVFSVKAKATKMRVPPYVFDSKKAAEHGICNRVLIVEPRQALRRSLAHTLEFLGLEVVQLGLLGELRCNIDDFSFIFVSQALFGNLEKHQRLLKAHCRIVVLAPFGKTLPKEQRQATILHSPFQQSKVIALFQNIERLICGQTLIKEEEERLLSEECPLSILLAEDNIVNTKVALQHLKRLGYIADHAKDGVQVVEMCRLQLESGADIYNVILMDIQMPRKDGIVAAVEVKQMFEDRGMGNLMPPVVALTANVAGDDRERCLQCGMIDFISKPLVPDELKRVLRDVSRNRQKAGEDGK